MSSAYVGCTSHGMLCHLESVSPEEKVGTFFSIPGEALNKSQAGATSLCGMGYAKGDNANGCNRAGGGAVSSGGRCDPTAGCRPPKETQTRSGIPAAARSPLGGVPRATLWGTTAQGGAVSSEGRCDPRSGMQAPKETQTRSGIPAAARSPLGGVPRATLWAHCFALPGIVDPATTCVVRLVIIPILPQRAPRRTCSGLPLRPRSILSLGDAPG